jgi:AcrR family transcriptional regulator
MALTARRQQTRPRQRKNPVSRSSRGASAGRAEKSAARRAAILEAALDEFSARGFAAARLDDVARKAGVAKGTIYLHFADKEALFQELVRTMLGPVIATLDHLRASDLPLRTVLEQFVAFFVGSFYGTRRRDVAHLVMSEGARFPKIAEFYYHEIVERGVAAMRALLDKAIARGEIPNTGLARFPHLVIAPAIFAILWVSLFDRFQHLDVPAMMQAHIGILLGQRSEP